MVIKIEPIFGKVNEGDKIKKTLDKFLGSPMRALGRKKNICFFGKARPKSNAHAHLKQRKKT